MEQKLVFKDNEPELTNEEIAKNTQRIDEKIKAAKDSTELPKFPDIKGAPPIFEKYLTIAGELTYSQREYHFATLLAAISMAIGRCAYIEVTINQKTYPNLFIMITGKTSISGKSTACGLGQTTLFPMVTHKPTLIPHGDTVEITDGDRLEPKNKVEIIDSEHSRSALIQALHECWNNLWYWDDCGAFFESASTWNKAIIPDMCKIYDGNLVEITYSKRRGGEKIPSKYQCPEPFETCFFNTTNRNVERTINGQLMTDGFVARWMWFYSENGEMKRNVKITNEHRKAMEAIQTELKNIGIALNKIGRDGVAFSINDLIEDWKINETNKHLDEKDEYYRTAISRGFIQIYKLAIILALADKNFRDTVTEKKQPTEIPDNYAQLAIKIVSEYLVPRCVYVSKFAEINDLKNHQVKVLNALKELGGAAEKSKIMKKTRLSRREMNDVKKDLADVEEGGTGEISIEQRRDTDSGKNTEWWIKNT